jgi:putative aminopeptidase FrvX
MAVPKVLRELLEAAGPSGYETAPARVWRQAAEAAGLEAATDIVGSCTARVAGIADGPRLAIVGHIDEIGLIVHHVDDDGFLWFRPVGGWDAQILVGQRVTLATRDGPLFGVIGKKPVHLMRDDEGKKVPDIRDLHIDIAAKDGDDARARVRVGDVAVIAAQPLEMPNGRLCSRALDNRLGAYVALEAARLIAEDGGAPGDVVAVAATQEEITFGGARTSAYALEPAVAIAVDVTHATDAPGIEVKQSGPHPLGSGPTLNRGSIIHPAVFELLHATAEEESIDFTIEASSRGTGTDADALHLTRAGIATGVVSIPLRYMHSPVEMVQLGDVQACARLIAAFAKRLTSEISFVR